MPQLSKSTQTSLSEINMVPFVDVVLVLLIIFMITAPILQSGIEVDVPKTRTVKEINQDGTAVLLVEQDVTLALEIADRGYVLEDGRVAMSGRAQDLRRDPAVRKAYLGV